MLKGIYGKESIDYSVGNTADDNIYAGVDGNPDYTDKTTINYLCAECHGVFHSSANETPADNTGAWLRHPSDIKLPADGISGDQYSGVAPATDGSVPLGQTGFTGVNLPESQAQPAAGAGIVLCISCHYSHGSANADILRWDYSTMQAGGAGVTDTGCFHCHTTKD
jgi:cytochrome c553